MATPSGQITVHKGKRIVAVKRGGSYLFHFDRRRDNIEDLFEEVVDLLNKLGQVYRIQFGDEEE